MLFSNQQLRLTTTPADSGYAATQPVRFGSKGSGLPASLAITTAAAKAQLLGRLKRNETSLNS